ncbi:MAG: Flp pilus assembly complex ATPase component TadA [Desulfobulbaceae bacterium]|nr:Flp pilus assembly complex ATPase component TadA [Desulfobulbaceae bacterium]
MNELVFSGERRLIGEMLVGAGKVEAMQLERALSHQATMSTRVGEILITLGYVSEDDIVEVLAEQLALPLYVPGPDDDFVAPEVSEFFHRSHPFALVFRGELEKLLLVSDPTDGDLFAAMDALSPDQYEVRLISETALKKIMADEYGLTAGDGDNDALLVDESDVDRLKDMASEAPVIKYVNSLIDAAVGRRASDIHMEPQEEGLLARFRVDGILQDFENPPHHLQAAIISRIKLMAALDIAERRLPQDGKIGMRISGKEIDLRVSTLPTVYGEGIVIRILEKASIILDLDSLGMQPEMEVLFRKTLKIQDGIILVTGPTGSGKTTTLYCALNQISNETNKVITIEDPVEYQLKGINQIQVRPEIDLTFAKGLRSIVRQDPDVIMIGEIRDLETAEIAVQSSLTGHLVFSTLHTNDAISAVTRMIDLGIERFLLVSSLRAVLGQRLVRRICPICKENRGLASEVLEELPVDGDFNLYEGRGCSHCGNSGYSGRVGLYELLVINEAMARAVSAMGVSRRGGDLADLKKIARESGFITMYEDGLFKARQGITSLAEVLRVTGR